jgi:hypothetical protein
MEGYDDIKKAIDQLLKVNSTVKRKKKAYLDKQKDLFISIIMAMQAVLVRTALVNSELKVDFSTYNEMFLQLIDSLILLHFGKEGFEVINFYLYDKFNPDGTVNELFDDEDKVVPSETPEDIWNILSKLKSDNEK